MDDPGFRDVKEGAALSAAPFLFLQKAAFSGNRVPLSSRIVHADEPE
jgi:hypothetical protein